MGPTLLGFSVVFSALEGSDLGVELSPFLRKQSSAHGCCCDQQKYQNQDVLVQNDSFCTLVFRLL